MDEIKAIITAVMNGDIEGAGRLIEARGKLTEKEAQTILAVVGQFAPGDRIRIVPYIAPVLVGNMPEE